MSHRLHLLSVAFAITLAGCAGHGTTPPLMSALPAPDVGASDGGADQSLTPSAGPGSCAMVASDTSYVLVSAFVAQPRGVVLDTLREILHREGYTIAAEDAGDGRLITAPRFGWPAGTETESWHGVENPGVVVVAAMSARGDSTGVTIATRAVCDVPAPGEQAPSAKVGNALRMMSAMRLAKELGGSFLTR